MFLLSVSLVALLHLSFVSAEAAHFPLVRKRSTLTVDDYLAAADAVRYKFGYKTRSTFSKRDAGESALFSQGDGSAPAGFAGVGSGNGPDGRRDTKKKTNQFLVVFDTGSSDFWVPGQGCTSCTPDTPAFDFHDSRTFAFIDDLATGEPKSVSIQYAQGSVNGSLAQDTLSVGSIKFPHQPFLLADTFAPGILSGTRSGVMGFGFKSIAATQSTPFWQNLVESGKLTSPEFSFWITRPKPCDPKNCDPKKEQPGGSFTLGGRNKTLFEGDVEFLPLATVGGALNFWTLNFVSATVNGNCIEFESGNVAIIDTGSSFISGPCDGVAEIYSKIPGSHKLSDKPGHYGFPCESTVEISLGFGGKVWPINPIDINLGPICPGSDVCLGAISELNESPGGLPTWIVGDTFLKNVYSVFHASPPSVGFAQLTAECEK